MLEIDKIDDNGRKLKVWSSVDKNYRFSIRSESKNHLNAFGNGCYLGCKAEAEPHGSLWVEADLKEMIVFIQELLGD